MKNHVITILISFAFLVSEKIVAQHYQPIKDGFVYQFIARDSIYSITGSGSNIIELNRTVKKGIRRVGTTSCIGTFTTYHEQPNNQLGERVLELPNGEFVFVVASGTTFPVQQQNFLLKTAIPVGTSWVMNASANLTATLTGNNVATFCGISDTVLVYNLSDGKQIILSKNYGLVQAPNFTAYVTNSDFKKRLLQLYKLPENAFQNTFNSPLKVFDFQPNDRFSYYKKDANSTFTVEEWYQNKILTRRNSPGGDSIYYTLEFRKLTRSGLTFSNIKNPPVLAQPVIQNLIITQNTNPELSVLTNEFYPGSTFFQSQSRAQVNTAIRKLNRYHQRETIKFTDYAYSTSTTLNCGIDFIYTPDLERYVTYGFGLGKVYDFSIDSWPNLAWDSLQAYVKGNETYGIFPDLNQLFTQITGQREPLNNFPFLIFPNPFATQVTLRFNSAFKGQKASVSIKNILGKEIHSLNIKETDSGETQLNLPDLPSGVYFVQVMHEGKTYITRLIKE